MTARTITTVPSPGAAVASTTAETSTGADRDAARRAPRPCPRLLIVTADYPPRVWSGIGVTVERQARGLAALGCAVDVLVASPAVAPTPGPHVVLGPSPLCDGDSRPTALGTDRDPTHGPRVYRLRDPHERCPVDPGGYDIVHLHSLALTELAVRICQRGGARLVYTVHSSLRGELDAGPATLAWERVLRYLLTVSAGVVFLGTIEREAALSSAGDAAGASLAARSSVVPNGVAPRPLPATRDGWEAHAGGPVVFAGRFTHSKGIDVLTAALPRVLAREAATPVDVVFAGGHGDAAGEGAVSLLVARYPHQCRAAGWLDRADLDRLLDLARLVLVPSRYEPFGLVAVEAMQAGAPVLAAAVGGLAETVAPGSGGLTLASHDPAVWANTITALLAAPEHLRELSARGPAHVAAHYDAGILARRLRDDVYAPLLGRRLATTSIQSRKEAQANAR